MTSNKFALVFGTNYAGTKYELASCVRDCQRISSTLESLNYNVTRFYSEEVPPIDTILPTFQNFFLSLKEGDQAIFYCSSHGTQVPEENKFDLDGNEVHSESDGMDEGLYISDDLIILDDTIREILRKVKAGVSIALFFDSCNSGSMCDLPYRFNGGTKFKDSDYVFAADILSISGCRDGFSSFEANGTGFLTDSVIKTISQLLYSGKTHPMKLRPNPNRNFEVKTWYDFYLNVRSNMPLVSKTSKQRQEVQISFTKEEVLTKFWL